MEVNNEIYETKGHGWWADDAAFGFSSLRLCLNPVRYGYFKRKVLQLQLPGKTVLDVGCGGGYLAEAFAEDGFMVTGVDPAARSIEAAQKHASEEGLTIDYRIGRGEALPFPDGVSR
jgi:2-polyprenyl-6-hydroxyphenyl methylase / 3-demethylubiquinone-9 3-methyltransferase